MKVRRSLRDDEQFLQKLMDAVFDAPEARSTRKVVAELIQRPVGPVALQWLGLDPDDMISVDGISQEMVDGLRDGILAFFSEDDRPTWFVTEDVSSLEISLSPAMRPVVVVPQLNSLVANKLAMLIQTVGADRLLICDPGKCGRAFIRSGKKGTGVLVACSARCYQRVYMRKTYQRKKP